MIEVQGKRVLVVGLGRSGCAAAQVLARRGAIVTVTDSRPPSEFRADLPGLLAQKIGLELGIHREATFLGQDLIVVSPGVYPEPGALRAARRQNIPVVPEVEVAGWFLKGRLLGITGTNGKTTTTALLGKMLEASGFPTFVGGNIGVPLMSAVDRVSDDFLLVAELSSFQLEQIRDFRPHVAVLLNLSSNHLDRHPSFDAYVRAKAQIFLNQRADDYAILNADDPKVMSLAPAIGSRKILFSRRQNLPEGVVISDGKVLYRVGNLERLLLETREVALRGDFNIENVLAAAAAACVVGADFEALRRAVREFRGIEHRLEFVREVRGVEFYNDSKATSVDATVKALGVFERGVHLILGGKDKGAPYAPLRLLLEGRVRYVYLIGAAADRIARELSGAAELIRAGMLEKAVREAFQRAVPGDTVLLAPACSSFDQFKDFEHRGRVFKELVESLVEGEKCAASNPPESPPRAGEEGGPAASPEGGQAQAAGANAKAQTEEQTASAGLPQEAPAESGTGEVASLPGEEETRAKPSGAAQAIERAGEQPARPEFIYVYEVSAEESAPLDIDFSPGHIDEIDGGEPANLPLPQQPDDELLPFEVRAEARAQTGQVELAPSSSPQHRSMEGVESPLAQGASRREAPAERRKRQARLPGM